MSKIYSFLLCLTVGVFLGCSDHSALTQSRQVAQPQWNASGPNFTGSFASTGPIFSDVDTISLGSTVVSNVVVGADASLYVVTRESSGVFTLYKINSTEEGTSIENQYVFTMAQDQAYLNLVIDANNSVYFSYNDSLHVIPNAFGSTGTTTAPVDLGVSTFDEHIPVLDGRGQIVVLKKQTGVTAKVGVYRLYDAVNTAFESVFESSETFRTNVTPTIVEDKLFVHTSTSLIQYDLLNIDEIVPVQNSVTIVAGTVPVRVQYVSSLDLLLYEYVDAAGTRSGIRVFSSTTGTFLSFLSYAEAGISMFVGVSEENRFKFLTSTLGIFNGLTDYEFVSNQLSILTQTASTLCVDTESTYRVDECTDSLALLRVQASYFSLDDSVVINVWDDSDFRMNRLDPADGNNIALAQTPNDEISINTRMTTYLAALFPNATDNQFPGFYSFDRPTLIESAIVYRNGSQLFIVR